MNYFNNVPQEINYLLQFYTHAQIDRYAKGSVDKIKELYRICQPKKVSIGSLKNKVKSKFFMVTSPDGYVPVVDCVEKTKDSLFKIKFSTGEVITASHDHLYQLNNLKWIYARELNVNDEVLHESGTAKVSSIEQINKKTKVYDLSVNHPNHRYYTDGICSHNTGKSLFLANLGLNWVLNGLNVLYLTFELSAELVSMRIDSMLTGIPSRDVFKNIDDIELKVKMTEKKAGAFQVKYMPTGKNANDLRAYIKEYEIQNNIKFDIILIDYLDLMFPIQKVSSENLFVKDKYVSEQLRNLAMELKSVVVTASQLNRDSVMETEFDHSHISGGISKINTADNVIGILTSRAMRERGKYQIQLMKTRSSSGVNTKIDLEFDVDTLRITDLDDDKNLNESKTSQPLSVQNSSILNTVMRKSIDKNIPDEVEEPTVKAEINSSKLKDFLNNLRED